jgi:hypothetical protein
VCVSLVKGRFLDDASCWFQKLESCQPTYNQRLRRLCARFEGLVQE